MPLLLLIPLLVLGVLALWALLLPISLVQRYRYGKARRRAQAWAVRINAVLLPVSAVLFVLGAWASDAWVPGALLHASSGLGIGVVVGIIGLWLTRFEPEGSTLYYRAPAWLVLLLTALVAARVLAALWQALYRWHAVNALPPLLADHASLFGVGGILLGYATAYCWGLKRRLAMRTGARGGSDPRAR